MSFATGWRPRVLLAVAFAAALFVSTFAVGAEVETAGAPAAGDLTPEQRQALSDQFDDAFQRMLEDPTDLDTTFEYAELAVALGNYEAAVSALERMLLFNPSLPRVRLELGVLYYRMQSFTTARAYFMRALADKNVPADVRERVQTFLDAMDRGERRHTFSGSIFSGIRWQSNALAGPSSKGVLVAGFGSTLDDEFVSTSDKNFFFVGNINHVYDFKTSNNLTLESNAILYWAEQEDEKSVELSLFEGTSGPRMDLSVADWLVGSARAYVIWNQVYLQDRRYFWTIGGGGSLSRAFGERVFGEFRFEHRRKRFRDITMRPTVTLLDANQNTIVGTLKVAPWANGLVTLTGVAFDENARRPFNSNREVAATIGYSHVIPSPVAIPAGPLAVNVFYSRVWTRYDEPDPTIDPNNKREDDEWRVGATVSLHVAAGVSAVFQIQRNFNDSNIPNFKFNNTAITGGLSWAF